MVAPRLKQTIDGLYTGRSQRATNFRYGLIAFDLASIAFFVATAPEFPTPFILAVDFILGLIILADFLARLWIAPDRARMLRQLYTIADILVILTLLLAPFLSTSFAFLRVLRATTADDAACQPCDRKRATTQRTGPGFRHWCLP